MKNFLYILLHVVMWIGAIAVFAFAIVFLSPSAFMDDFMINGMDFYVLSLLFLGLYVCAIAFCYAYRPKHCIKTYRLYIRMIMSALTLISSFEAIILLSLLFFTEIYPERIRHYHYEILDFVGIIAGCFGPVIIITLCVYVFVNSLPKIYNKKTCPIKTI